MSTTAVHWYQEAEGRARLAIEARGFAQRFPHFRLRRDHAGGLFWSGVVEPEPGQFFALRVVYPDIYPDDEPTLYVDAPALRRDSPHRYEDGGLCVRRKRWNPDRYTAISETVLGCLWLKRYLDWGRTGRWAHD
jgi:hypothetical protein